MVHFLVYASSATRPFSQDDILRLLEASRANNRRDGITGMLLHKDGNFMQLLEGEQAAVAATHARILADPRHEGVFTLLQGDEENRQFPDWSMGLHQIGRDDPISASGLNEFLNTPLTGAEFKADPTMAQRLLLSFKKRM